MNNQFSENLKKIRKENNLSQEGLADELGVSRQAISKWESGTAYPEMDKIIALCNKFNVNIDDLLHNDIKEVKKEEDSKKTINSFIDNFLKYITDTINLFSNMTFKSKIKCLFEQAIFIIVFIFLSELICFLFDSIFTSILVILPDKLEFFIKGILNTIVVIICILSSIMIISHIFKTRYLDYYDRFKEEADSEKVNNDGESSEDNSNNKIDLDQKKDKIVIRDPKHSEYRFINGLFKFIILIIKIFAGCFAFPIAISLIAFFIAFIVSFLLYKTGLFFIGLLIMLLSFSVIAIIILLILLNFIFNRKNNKKMMIYSFVISLIMIGIGCGLVFTGSINFNVTEFNEGMIKNVTKEYQMQDDLVVFPYTNHDKVEFIESNNENIKVDYYINKYCQIEDVYDKENNHNIVNGWIYCNNPIEIARDFIRNANEKRIVPINTDIEKIIIYTNKANIEKLKMNILVYEEDFEKSINERNRLEKEIDDLEQENERLQERIEKLENNN